MTREAALERLLLALFSPKQLRMLLADKRGGDELVQTLPWGPTPKLELFAAAVTMHR